ncbi:MAG: DUF1292 domain-containing protein [Candidatus Cloacimonetes bacterium]|nr:DUF1292 domain-containing protein [Candidatus Cloacimonadota bacterium]
MKNENLEETLNDDQYLTLEWEDGSSTECEIIDKLELDGKNYIALLPKDDDQAIIFAYTEIDDEMKLDSVEDEEFEKVSAKFLENLEDEGNGCNCDSDHEHKDDNDKDEDCECGCGCSH